MIQSIQTKRKAMKNLHAKGTTGLICLRQNSTCVEFVNRIS